MLLRRRCGNVSSALRDWGVVVHIPYLEPCEVIRAAVTLAGAQEAAVCDDHDPNVLHVAE